MPLHKRFKSQKWQLLFQYLFSRNKKTIKYVEIGLIDEFFNEDNKMISDDMPYNQHQSI